MYSCVFLGEVGRMLWEMLDVVTSSPLPESLEELGSGAVSGAVHHVED
jgi:hypothetical protein